MRLFLIRHGETAWNRFQVFRGRADVQLNEHGIEQAERLGAALKGLDIAAVYTSPLSRSAETARYIASPHGLEVESEEGLNDLNYGTWQGLSHEEVKVKYPESYQLWKTAPHQIHFEGGESLKEVLYRSIKVLDKIAEFRRGQNVVAVSHRVVIKVVLCHYLGLSVAHFWRIKQDTCAVNVVELTPEGEAVICHLNDISHLGPMHRTMETIDF